MRQHHPPTPSPSRSSAFFGIQAKLFLLVGFFALILLGMVLYGLYGLRRISQTSAVITKEKIPLVISLREALVAMVTAKLALENALAVSDFARLEEIQSHQAVLQSAANHFEIFVAALTWGSESEAFTRSAGGLNARRWQRLQEKRRFVVPRASPREADEAALAKIYFRGLTQNALKAIASHKRMLRLGAAAATSTPPDLPAQTASLNARVLRFSDLVTEHLGEVTQLVNQGITESALAIERIQTEVRQTSLMIFGSGLLLTLAAGLVFVQRSIVWPLKVLTRTAERIGAGDLAARPTVSSRDELGILASVFNQMADRLTEHARTLEQRVQERTARLTELNQELNEVAKILVRRDLELTQANLRLEELDRLKSEFVTVAAHQLRTPLAGIRWSLTALTQREAGALNAEQAKLADGALRVTLTMIDLINDLLNVARIEEGRFGFHLIAQGFLPLIADLLPRFTKLAAEKGVALKAQLPRKSLPALKLDGEKMAMALDNLLDNAIKYTPPGGTVTLKVAEKRGALAVEVKDTGIGVPQNQLAQLFTKFFRADNALLFQTSGTGLGLYVVKNIIDHHGGTITIESEEGKGTTVTLTLPIPQLSLKSKV